MIKALILLVTIAVAALAALGTSRPADLSASHSICPKQESRLDSILSAREPRDVDTVADLVGAYIFVDSKGKRAQIIDAIWGVTHEGNLGYARLHAIEDDGHVIEYNQPELYERLAFRTSDLAGAAILAEGGARSSIEEISYVVDSDGNVAVARWKGRDPHGALFIADYRAHLITRFSDSLGDDPAPAPICCGAFTSTRCLPDPTCDGNCPGPSNCACSGNGGCELLSGLVCRGKCGSGCPGNGACGGTPPLNCGCS